MVREESLFVNNSITLNTSNRKKSSPEESLNKSRDTKDSVGEQNYKTELCRTWVEKNYCPYKEKCRFAHGKKDLHEKSTSSKNYKQKECHSFYNKGFCPYGPRCHFKHEERTLYDITRAYYPFLLNSQATLEKFNSIANSNISKYRFCYSRPDLDSQPNLKIFEKIRGQAPAPMKYFPIDPIEPINQIDEIKYGREFFLPRKFLDSYM